MVLNEPLHTTGKTMPNNVQGVSENTDTFLSLPALVFITP